MGETNVKEFENTLKDIYSYVNYWLQFAEAKNIALIAFNIAFLTILLNSSISILIAFSSSILILSTICCLVSFIPFTSINNTKADCIKEEDNLFFYKDIAKYDADQYLQKIAQRYFENISVETLSTHKIAIDYIKEIICNAKIACRKYRFFKSGLFLDIIALITTIIFIIEA